MHPALGVHEGQAGGRLLEDVLPLFADESGLLPLDAQLEVAGRKELHHEIGVLRVAADGDDADDVRVGQLLADVGLVQQETADTGGCGRLLGQQQLHGEMPTAGVPDFPDLAGLAGHHVLEQPIAADHLVRHVRPPEVRGQGSGVSKEIGKAAPATALPSSELC